MGHQAEELTSFGEPAAPVATSALYTRLRDRYFIFVRIRSGGAVWNYASVSANRRNAIFAGVFETGVCPFNPSFFSGWGKVVLGAFYKHCHKNLAFLPSFEMKVYPIPESPKFIKNGTFVESSCNRRFQGPPFGNSSP
jgi:hypothetical protein